MSQPSRSDSLTVAGLFTIGSATSSNGAREEQDVEMFDVWCLVFPEC